MLIKGFCEDVLKAIDMLDAGNCSLKGFVCHRLLDVHRRLKKMHGFVHCDEVWEDNSGPSSSPYGNESILNQIVEIILVDVSAVSTEFSD